MANSLLKELLQPSVEDHTETTSGYGIDSIEYASLEMMEAAAEVERHEQALAEFEEIAAGLESINESMQASMEQGGMDPVAAQFAHHAVGAYTERLGLEAADQLPALESFGGDTGRQSSTEISMESVKETLVKIFEAIRRAIEAVIKAVTDFFTRLFSNAEKLEKAVDATQKKVQDAKGSPSEKTRVPNPDTIAYQGKVTIGAVTSGIATTNRVFGVLTNDYLSAATKGQINLMTSLKDAAYQKDDERGLGQKLWDGLKSTLRDFTVKVKGLESKLNSEVSGGREVKFETKGEGDETEVTVSFAKVENAKKVENAEIDTPNKNDLGKMLSEAKKLAGSIKGAKTSVEGAVKDYREVHKLTSDLNKDAKGGKLGKFAADTKYRVMLRIASKNMVQPVQQFSQHSWSVTRSAIAMAEASLKNYKES